MICAEHFFDTKTSLSILNKNLIKLIRCKALIRNFIAIPIELTAMGS